MNAESNSRKFKDDRVVNLIDKNFISLKDEDMKRNNKILHRILDDVLNTVKEKDEFFRDHYRKIIFVGSYYKGTKVGKPEEFDLDLIIQLPMKYESIKFEGNVPGYTKLKLNADSYKLGWESHNKILSKWVSPEGYLNQDEFRQYMESSLKNIPKSVKVDDKTYKLNLRKSGPAFTLRVEGSDSMEMSVDLVPVLEFTVQPPVPGNFSGESWFAVPKTNRALTDPHFYWRMSFYSFEKGMLKRNGFLKPVIRQLKKLRDTTNWKLIASYHIETLFLHRIKAIESNPELQKNSKTQHFVDMLSRLKEACETNKIINFWNESHNLFEEVKPAQLTSIVGRLGKIIKHIESDPFAIADYVLTKEERSSIEIELRDYRNSGKTSEPADQQAIEANETNVSYLNFNQSMWTTSKKETPIVAAADEKAPIIAAAGKKKASISTAVENKNSSSNSTEKNDGFAEIMIMLKSIQSEMAQTKDIVNLLTRRVAAVEDKIDILLMRV